MGAVLRFVDRIDDARVTRLDLNDEVWGLLREGTVFEPPPIKRAEVSTLLRDGERYPAAAYGNRRLRFAWTVGTASADLVAAQLQRLQRELDRPMHVLEWRPSGVSKPVFFRTFRSPPDFVREWRGDDGRKYISAEVMAEPFAYGLPEVPAGSPFTVSNNPAPGTNPQYFEVTGVKGDMPAATQIIGATSQWFNVPGWLAMRRRGTPSNAPFLIQAEAATQGTDTTTQVNDASMSGSGNNYSRCTFATNATMVTRLSGAFPGASPFTDVRGLYRIFARYRHSVAGDVINIQFKVGTSDQGSASKLTHRAAVPLQQTTAARFADLGLVQFPLGVDPIYDGPSGTELTVQPSDMLWALQAERVSGTGNVDFDYIVLVPADDIFMMISQGSDSTGRVVFDSWADQAYTKSTLTGRLTPASDIVPLGGMPELAPGVTNRVYVTSGYLNTTSSVLDVRYWPRHLYVAAVTP